MHIFAYMDFQREGLSCLPSKNPKISISPYYKNTVARYTTMQNNIGLLMKHLNEQIEKEANRLLKQHGLIIAQMHIIEHLYLHQRKPATQKEREI